MPIADGETVTLHKDEEAVQQHPMTIVEVLR